MRNKWGRILLTAVCIMILLGTSVWAAGTNHMSDLVGVFQDIEVPSGMTVYGSVVAIFGDIQMKGAVTGDVVAIFGDVKIDGPTKGNVVAIFGDLHLASKAAVNGDTVQILGGRTIEEPGAIVTGQKVSLAGFGLNGLPNAGIILVIFMLITLVKIIIDYLISIIAVLVFPERFENMASAALDNMGKKFLIGILIILGFYILSAVLVMVIIGIPFMLLLVPAMALLSFTGNTAVKLAIGKRIGSGREKPWSQMMELFIGTLVYALVEITLVGKSVTFLAKAVGIGAVIDTKGGNGGPHVQAPIGFITKRQDEEEIMGEPKE